MVQIIKQRQAGNPQAAGRPDAAAETLKGITGQLRNAFRGSKKSDAKKPDAKEPKASDSEKKPDGSAAPATGTGK